MGPEKENRNVVFHINGVRHSVECGSNEIGSGTVLADYIRDVANLKGTKVMCREGGCGACVVTTTVVDPASGHEVTKSVNSCLTPVLSCDGWDISTVERLGNKNEGYHLIQKRLVNYYGTQCGYCTPGMVMSMYSLLGATNEIWMDDVEKHLDGNICRCTGYRPILDAFKFASYTTAKEDNGQACTDIEDCGKCPLKVSKTCFHEGLLAKKSGGNHIKLSNGQEWLTATTVEEALSTAAKCKSGGQRYRFVAANTSSGILKDEGPYKVFIDINGIPELKRKAVEHDGLHLGGGITITEAIHFLNESATMPGFEYGTRVASHLERVANMSVRNNGTLAGNLMIKHAHKEFTSDVFVLLEALDGRVTIRDDLGNTKVMSMAEFLEADMSEKLITTVSLPKREGYYFRSFKINRRYQNSRAFVNAAMLLKVNKSNAFTVEEKPRIVYGGISSTFVHASMTETWLEGRSLTESTTFEGAFEALDQEVKPEVNPLDTSPEYRLHLTKTLLYKTILDIVGETSRDKSLVSGAGDLVRRNNKGTQVLDKALEESSSLYKAVPKYEGSIQASGEAEYIADIPLRPDELYGAFVLSSVACADVKSMNASEAMKIPGVVRFITAEDIPGENNLMGTGFLPPMAPEPLFVSDRVSYHGQALGLIVATSRNAANEAAKSVKVTYDNITKPVVSITEAIAKARKEGTFDKQTFGTFTSKPDESIKLEHSFKGKLNFGAQYHFHMETQSCVCHPREDGLDIYCSTQWMDHVQGTVAQVLNIPNNSINLQVRRVGGGFGGKITRPSFVASACALASWLTARPVRILLDLEANMNLIGKRLPYDIPYEVAFDENGRIGKLDMDLTCDTGYAPNEYTSILAAAFVQNVYKSVGWTVLTHFVTTDTPSNTFCRAPGSVQGIAAIEWIMDRVASYLNKNPIAVREANMLEAGDELFFPFPHAFEQKNFIPEMVEQMKKETGYDARCADIEEFNKVNRWKKRGIAVVPVRHDIDYYGMGLPATVTIYHQDGQVAVTTGGIEMGQGLNTKIIQIAAHTLNVPMEYIKIKPANNFVGSNASASCASVASELVINSVMRACEQLRENLKPIEEKLENPSWEQLIGEAFKEKVKLSATHLPKGNDDLQGYNVWVLTVTEVEIDVLTGEYNILRTDLYEDTGKSLSPGVDLGQIEGGYVFAQGFWTTEKIIHDENTGKLLTNGTWDYKPPAVKDIPEDFRITLLSNAPNPRGVLRSKATGEPSTDSSFVVVLALRNAIAAARADSGITEWFEMGNAVTAEDVAQLCATSQSQLVL